MTNTEHRSREVLADGQRLSSRVLDEWYEASKLDHHALVGSEVRQLIGELRRARESFASPPTTGGDATQGGLHEKIRRSIAFQNYPIHSMDELEGAALVNVENATQSVMHHVTYALATAQAAEGEEAPCSKCDDSGFVERYSGGVWTGEGVRSTQNFCDCACGDDARRQYAKQPTTDPVSREAAASEGLDRSPPQFFFEVGYGACWAEAFVRNGSTPPFPLTDAVVERAWEIAREAHDDPEEFDRYLSALRALPAAQAGDLTSDFARVLPGGKMDDATFSDIEDALDRIDAPAVGKEGNWLTLPERIAALSPPSTDGEEG